MALVSDAGTPLLSDPGARLVQAAIDAGVTVTPIPGASALLAALVVSGLPGEQFTFFGFLPRRGRERTAVLTSIAELGHLAVMYEAPGRTGATLGDLAAAGAGDRPAAVARELTKQFEEVRRGTVAELAAYYVSEAPRGDVVILIGGGQPAALDQSRNHLGGEVRRPPSRGRDAATGDCGADDRRRRSTESGVPAGP
jgi:16S rRNA (cytidine1402-2'-O)-methyltransferase